MILKYPCKILNNRVKWVINVSHPISFLSTFLSTLHLTSCTFPTPPRSKLKLKWLIILISYHPYSNSKTISNHLISYHPHPIWKTIFRLSYHHFLKNPFKPMFYDFPRLLGADGTPLPSPLSLSLSLSLSQFSVFLLPFFCGGGVSRCWSWETRCQFLPLWFFTIKKEV